MSFSPWGTARLATASPTTQRAPEIGDYPATLVELARDLARLEPNVDGVERQALAAIVLAALAALEAGSTRVPIASAQVKRAGLALGLDEGLDGAVAAVLERELEVLSRDPDAYVPLILEDGHLYLQRMLQLERRFARSFADKARVSVPVDRAAIRSAVAEVATAPLPLSEEQARAVEQAAIEGLTVISGGPGTGKTSIVVALLRVLIRTGVEPEQIALAAPTGKAANRMEQAVRSQLQAIEARDDSDAKLLDRCPEAQTLHRLLGYSPKDATFRHHEENRLAEKVVIVDESSMIDLVLMERILRSIRPDARLVLLGDTEQLPSVDAGAVLRDIRTADPRFTVMLTRSYRVNEADSAGLLAAARAVNAGDRDTLHVDRTARVDALRLEGVELLTTPEDGRAVRHAFIGRWYEERTKAHRDHLRLSRRHYRFANGRFTDEDIQDLENLLAHQSRFQLLALTRHLVTGADALNESLHRLVLQDQRVPAAPFLCGEPVMMQKNDYERGLFNGDQGVVLSVITDDRPHPMAVFRTAAGWEPFHLEALARDLRLSHAITVHKSQGSEFDHVALFLPSVDVPLASRELIYTALTRARRAVTIVGPEVILVNAITRRVERFSGLSSKIATSL